MSKRSTHKTHTSLNKHIPKGSKLIPPLGDLNLQKFDWHKDLLPEHLWIASLAEHYPLDSIYTPFNEFLDAFDKYIDKNDQAIGLITDFSLIKAEKRKTFINENRHLIKQYFYKPLGRILAFYPDCPAYWIIEEELKNDTKSISPDTNLEKLRIILKKLFKGKDYYTGHIRTLPLSRISKHGKLVLVESNDVGELLGKYPSQCNDDEKYHVQSFARSSINVYFNIIDQYKDKAWSKYFWRNNFNISNCKPNFFPLRQTKEIPIERITDLEESLKCNSKMLLEYLENLYKKVKIDIYDPLKEEVLFGLFSRIIRLYTLIISNTSIWAKDISGILLRSFTDIAIVFCYLSKHGEEGDFKNFQEYGDGQEKLLLLHLQDNYPDDSTIEGLEFSDFSEELGHFDVETIKIELKSWTKKDTRTLAKEAEMEKYYRLVFSPTSADLHGSWHSLKHTSLSVCGEILHRFHRLPNIFIPPVYLNSFLVAQEIISFCLDVANKYLNYPELEQPLKSLRFFEKEKDKQ